MSALVACNRTAPTPDNPDGVDPPQRNPVPTQKIKIRVIAPPTLRIELKEVFNAPHDAASGLAHLCIEDGGKPQQPGHTRTVPIALRRDAEGYSGEITVDRFVPGRCHWGFAGISSVLPKVDVPVGYTDYVVLGHQPDQVANIWCGKSPVPHDSQAVVCAFFGFFEKYSPIRARLLAASISSADRADSGLVFSDPSTRSITLRYHDFDAENVPRANVARESQ